MIMSLKPDAILLEQVDGRQLQKIRIGDSLIRYRRKNNLIGFLANSLSAEFIIYRVADLPDESCIILSMPLARKQSSEKYERSELLSGEWWVCPIEFKLSGGS
jgi:hypothetical protein